MLATSSKIVISDSKTMGGHGGGFYLERSLQVSDGSILRVRNVYAHQIGGAFVVKNGAVLVRNNSDINIDNAIADVQAGGFITSSAKNSNNVLVSGHSRIRIADCHSGIGSGGGIFTSGLIVSEHSAIMIRNCSTGGDVSGGGFYVQSGVDTAEAAVLLANSSIVSIHATNAAFAGGFSTDGQVLVANNSTLQISDSHASKFSGGFSSSSLQVTDQSAVFFENVTAAREIGGFRSDQGVLVSNSSEISIRRAVAGKHGGGFSSYGPVVVAQNSQISVSDSYASSGCCAGFRVIQELAGALAAVQVTGGSTISVSNTAARLQGGGFAAWRGDVVIADGSNLRIRNTASSSSFSGGFSTDQRVLVANNSLITIRNSTAGQNSGGFWTKRLEVTDLSTVHVKRTKAGRYGGGFSADDLVRVAGNSKITVTDSHAIEGNGGGFQTSKLYLDSNSSIDLETTSAGWSGGGSVRRSQLQCRLGVSVSGCCEWLDSARSKCHRARIWRRDLCARTCRDYRLVQRPDFRLPRNITRWWRNQRVQEAATQRELGCHYSECHSRSRWRRPSHRREHYDRGCLHTGDLQHHCRTWRWFPCGIVLHHAWSFGCKTQQVF